MPIPIRHFDSISEFYEECKQGKVSSRWTSGSRTRSSRRTPGDGEYEGGFYGTKSFEEAYKLAMYGWKEGTEKARVIVDRLSAELIETLARPQVEYDVTGEQFDIGRVIMEEPECWMKWSDGLDEGIIEAKTGPIKIVLNSTVSAGISKEIIQVRGAAVMALAMIFDAANRPVMVEIVSPIKDQSIEESSVVLKHYFDPISLDTMAFALVHPSFFRRMVFSMWETMDIHDQYGYGYPTDSARDKGDIYLGQAMYGAKEWRSVESAETWVKQQLEMQGVRFHA